MNRDIADIRKDYLLEKLDETSISADAITQFTHWWNEALSGKIEEPNAMTLATATAAGIPSARIVLLKGYDEKGFVFFTNYSSNKGNDLLQNPYAALVFFWRELERQVRIEGTVEKVSEEESDAYFISRPPDSRIGAWVSPQSAVIKDRMILDENVKLFTEKFGEQIPRPPHWGGYRVLPVKMEFWQGRASRLHDRIQYTKNENGTWLIQRLAP